MRPATHLRTTVQGAVTTGRVGPILEDRHVTHALSPHCFWDPRILSVLIDAQDVALMWTPYQAQDRFNTEPLRRLQEFL